MEKITNNFKYPEKLYPVIGCSKRNIILYGGRGGSKSWFVAAYLILLSTQKEKQIILCTREVQNTIKDSVHKLLSDTISRMGLDYRFEIKRDEIVCKNKSKFIFKGLRNNVNEIKSTEGINYCWIEEAQSISVDSMEVLWPTVRQEGSQILATFNPKKENDPVYQEFVINKREDSLVVNINYSDNPFFPNVLRKEMEYDKQYNHDKYLHVWAGKCKNITEACIFKGKFSQLEFKTHEDAEFFYGADWGFSNDPTCMTRCYIHDDTLYIDYEAYGVGVEIDEIKQLFSSVPGYDTHLIRGDNQRPDTISFLNRSGLNIKGAKKGPGSVEDGIEFIRSFKHIYIHPRCKNTLYEFESYSYKKDKQTNEILNVIIDKDNHCIDSIRYSLRDIIKGLTIPYKPSNISVNQLFGK